MVKMYELDTRLEQAEAATQAAAEFRDFVLALVAERRRTPQDDVARLVEARVDGRRLTDLALVSSIVVLLNAGTGSRLAPPHARRRQVSNAARRISATRGPPSST